MKCNAYMFHSIGICDGRFWKLGYLKNKEKVSQRSILKDAISSWVGKPKGTF